MLASVLASAAPVTWRLVGVRFADGGTASGSLVYESADQTITSWNVQVQGGGTSTFPPFAYVPNTSTTLTFQVPNEPVRTLFFSQNNSTRRLRMQPSAPMTDAGGAFSLNVALVNSNIECFNCSPSRQIVAGSLIAEDASGDTLRFGEILFDPPGNVDAPHEFIELVGAAGAIIGPNTFIVGVDGDQGSTGAVHTVFDVSGRQFGANGRLVLAQAGFPVPVAAEASFAQAPGPGFTGLPGYAAQGGANSIANGSSTFLLVRAAIPPQPADDLDIDDNGTVDLVAVQSGWLIFDAVGVLDGGSSDRGYGRANFSPGGGTSSTGPVTTVPSAAGYLARFIDQPDPDAAAWVVAAVVGDAPAFTLAQATPNCFNGTTLSHVGAPNPDCPVGVFSDGFEPPP
jgi:hypothetical protein